MRSTLLQSAIRNLQSAISILCLLSLVPGCASAPPKPQWVYFPPEPDPARVVHLVSFNRLSEIVPPESSWLDFWTGSPLGPWVGTPLGIAYGKDRLYICDTSANCVHVWNLSSGASTYLGAADALGKPVAVAVSECGKVFVADTVKRAVLAFNEQGKFVGRISIDPEHYRPVALACSDSRLFVADLGRHRVDIFSLKDFELIESWDGAGSNTGRFYYPSGLAVDARGRVYVAEMMNSRVQVFSEDGQFLRTVGSPGNHYGNLGSPKAAAVAPDGSLLIADSGFRHVHFFDSDGRLLMLLGGPHDRPGGTPLPNGIAVASALPGQMPNLVPDGFVPSYYVWVSNTTGRKRIALFAVGTFQEGQS